MGVKNYRENSIILLSQLQRFDYRLVQLRLTNSLKSDSSARQPQIEFYT